MMCDVSVVNWTAIGAGATALAVITALFANYRTNRNNEKNRKLQIALLRQQRAQKKLDEMVQNVMQLSKSMDSLEILHYSLKFTNNTFTVEDKFFLEHLAAEGSDSATKLTIQMVMLNNQNSAQPMLDCFWEIWSDYGLWSSSISTLYNGMNVPKRTNHEPEVLRIIEDKIVKDMMDKTVKINVRYKSIFDKLLKNEKDSMARARVVLSVFGPEIAGLIQRKKDVLNKKVIDFIRVEQKRIDAIVE